MEETPDTPFEVESSWQGVVGKVCYTLPKQPLRYFIFVQRSRGYSGQANTRSHSARRPLVIYLHPSRARDLNLPITNITHRKRDWGSHLQDLQEIGEIVAFLPAWKCAGRLQLLEALFWQWLICRT